MSWWVVRSRENSIIDSIPWRRFMMLFCFMMIKPIGCAAFKHYEEGIAEMKRVFLHNEYRGNGYAKELIRRLEELAKSKGYRTLILETGKPLEAALGLYAKLGYQIIENYGQYKDMPLSVCMKKDI
jgi:GNAT superfamily N-acetyltransferase